MQICDDGHDEIVFERSTKYSGCPLCEAMSTMANQEKELEKLQKEMAEHECK